MPWPKGSGEATGQLEYAKRWIDRFADMGAPVVRVFAGRSIPKRLTDEQVIDHVTANLSEALEHAEKRGVILGLENHDFVKNIDYLLEILGRIDSKWLGVIWDSANLAPTPDPYAQLERIAPYAVTAQVKVMTKVWYGELPMQQAIDEGEMKLLGNVELTRSVTWPIFS